MSRRKDSRSEPGLGKGAGVQDVGQDSREIHEHEVPGKAENMEKY